MDAFALRFSRFFIKYRGFNLAIIGGLTLFFLYQALQLQVFSQFIDLLPRNHPFIQVYEKYNRQFGSANVVAAAIVAKTGTSIYSEDFLEKVYAFTDQIDKVEGVDHGQIASITAITIRDQAVDREGIMRSHQIIGEQSLALLEAQFFARRALRRAEAAIPGGGAVIKTLEELKAYVGQAQGRAGRASSRPPPRFRSSAWRTARRPSGCGSCARRTPSSSSWSCAWPSCRRPTSSRARSWSAPRGRSCPRRSRVAARPDPPEQAGVRAAGVDGRLRGADHRGLPRGPARLQEDLRRDLRDQARSREGRHGRGPPHRPADPRGLDLRVPARDHPDPVPLARRPARAARPLLQALLRRDHAVHRRDGVGDLGARVHRADGLPARAAGAGDPDADHRPRGEPLGAVRRALLRGVRAAQRRQVRGHHHLDGRAAPARVAGDHHRRVRDPGHLRLVDRADEEGRDRRRVLGDVDRRHRDAAEPADDRLPAGAQGHQALRAGADGLGAEPPGAAWRRTRARCA